MGLVVPACAVVPAAASAFGLPLGDPATSAPSAAISSADADFAAGEQRDRARRERLASGDTHVQRTRSLTAYRGLGGEQALALAREMFPEQLTGRLFDGARPGAGVRVVDQRGGGAALVEEVETGRRALLMSTLPLQAKRSDGAFAPIDLSLESAAGGVGPTNSLAPFRVDAFSAAKLSFPGKGVSVSVRGGERRLVQRASDRAFFANVLEDTDVGVIPLPDGAELFVVVRSPRAPERFVLEVELPEGAWLRRAVARDAIAGDPPKSLEIVRGEETLGYIHPPIAIDADGEAVPTTMALEGQSVVLAVPHRDRDIRYPVNVDPEMRLYSDYYADWLRWDWNQTRLGASDGSFGATKNDCAYYCGLYQSVPTNTTLTNGSYAQWYYRAPLNSYLYRTTFGGIAHNPLNAYGYDHTRAFQGLMNASYTAWESNVNYVNQAGIAGPNPYGPHSGGYYGLQHDFCFNPRCDANPAAASEQNFALFGLQAQNAFGGTTLASGPYKGSTTMAWANVYLGDRRPPSLTTATPASRDWTDEPANTQHTIGVGVHDDGLGIWGIGLDGAASGGGFVRHGCEGHIDHSPCPPDWSKDFNYTLNEGINTLTAYGEDFVDNRTAAGTWTEKIDRSAPSINDLSGSLHDARDRDDDRRFVGLYNDAYALRVRGSDAHSGVREIEVYVDNQSQRSRGGYAAGGALDWTFRPDDHSDGQHSVEVVIRDNVAGQAGTSDDRHVVRRAFSVTADRRGEIYRSTEHADNENGVREVMSTEAAKLAEHRARHVDDEYIVTRSGSEVRTSTRISKDEAGAAEGYHVRRGHSVDDPNLEPGADMLHPAAAIRADKLSLVGQGPLPEAMQPWQTAPPAHGLAYKVYEKQAEAEDGSVTTFRVWVDETTLLPLKSTGTASGEPVVPTQYWTYEVERLADQEVPADFFRYEPQRTAMNKDETQHGQASVGQTHDAETNALFRPYFLGQSPALLAGGFCLVGSRTVRHATAQTEPTLPPDPDLASSELADPRTWVQMTDVTAYYRATGVGIACLTGVQRIDSPTLSVTSMARGSSQASLWRELYVEEGEAIHSNPLDPEWLLAGVQPVLIGSSTVTAYVLQQDGRTSALLDINDTTLLVEGPYLKSELVDVARKLELL